MTIRHLFHRSPQYNEDLALFDLSEDESTPPITSPNSLTPDKNYPVVEKNGKITVLLTPGIKEELKNKQPMVYRWKNTTTDQRLPGVSTDTLSRLHSYTSRINSLREEKISSPLKIEAAIASSPEKFTFGIIKKATSQKEADSLENQCILTHDTRDPTKGYSTRRGGGGGTARPKPIPLTPEQEEEIGQLIQKAHSEIQWRQITSKTLRNKVVLTHSFSSQEKKKTEQVYLLRGPKDENDKHITYLGCTDSTISQRMSQHFSYMNRGKNKLDIYPIIKENASNSHTALLPTESILEKFPGMPIGQIETIAKRILQPEYTFTNKREGGGGGAAKK